MKPVHLKIFSSSEDHFPRCNILLCDVIYRTDDNQLPKLVSRLHQCRVVPILWIHVCLKIRDQFAHFMAVGSDIFILISIAIFQLICCRQIKHVDYAVDAEVVKLRIRWQYPMSLSFNWITFIIVNGWCLDHSKPWYSCSSSFTTSSKSGDTFVGISKTINIKNHFKSSVSVSM